MNQTKAPDTTQVHRSSQNCAFWVRNCCHVTLQASRNWRELLGILKMLWIPDLAPCYSLSLSLSYVHLIYSVHHSNAHYKTSRCQFLTFTVPATLNTDKLSLTATLA